MKQIEYRTLSSSSQKQQDAVTRLFEGRQAWNRWAEDLLAEQQSLIEAGKWQVEHVWREEQNAIITSSDIPETQAWLTRATVDFSGLTFTSRVKEYLDQRIKSQGPERPNHLIVLEGEYIDLSGYIFPGLVIFNNCTFKTKTILDHAAFQADASFRRTVFEGQLSCDHTLFEGDAWFEATTFKGSARFIESKFCLAAWFSQARFLNKVKFKHCITVADFWLTDALFKGRASFENCFFKSDLVAEETQFKNRVLMKSLTIDGQAYFREARFASRIRFENMTFRQAALFTQCDFNGYTILNHTTFKRSALFKAIHVSAGFTMEDVTFETEVPNFRQALFSEPARLKNVEILPAPNRTPFSKPVKQVLKAVRRENRWIRKLFFKDWVHTQWLKNRYRYYRDRFTNARRKPTDETYFKTLGRIAVEADNLKAEKQFLAGEVRARRHLKDRISGIPTGTLNYIVGVLSELTSNFGRSLMRPLFTWGVLFIVFTGVYLKEASNPLNAPCVNNKNIHPLEAARSIGLGNAFRLNWPFQEHMNEMHRCLYGEKAPVKKARKDESRLDGLEDVKATLKPQPIPKVPSEVVMWGLLHTALSFLLIGVFALNLRNRFKT